MARKGKKKEAREILLRLLKRISENGKHETCFVTIKYSQREQFLKRAGGPRSIDAEFEEKLPCGAILICKVSGEALNTSLVGRLKDPHSYQPQAAVAV
jgi:hypothetical protein